MSKPVVYLVFLVAVLGIGILIGFVNLPGAWYQSLAKPPFTPPNWLFAPAWTVIYILIALAGARTWLAGIRPAGARSAGMQLWFAQMILNFLWSPAFFGLQMPKLGLCVILALLLSILAFIVDRWRRDPIATLLFVPYAAWVAFATLLNGSIVYLN